MRYFFLALLSSSLLLYSLVSATRVYIDPPRITGYEIGDTFELKVMIKDVEDLYSFQFYLSYDSSILSTEQEDIEIDFIEGPPHSFQGSIIVPAENYLSVYATYLGSKKKSGSGVLATITFKVIGRGRSNLRLYETIILNHAGDEIYPDVESGVFDNTRETTTTLKVEPTTTSVTTSTSSVPFSPIEKKPQWSNLRHEPELVTPYSPVDIFVSWLDDLGLKQVIISENSSGKWVEHIVYGG